MMKLHSTIILTTFLSLVASSFGCDQITGDSSVGHIYEEHIRPYLSDHLSENDIKNVDDFYDSSFLGGLSLKSIFSMFGTANMNETQCGQCKQLMGLSRALLKSEKESIDLVKGLCKDSPKLSSRMCVGLAERLAGPIIWILHQTNATAEEICVQLTSSTCLKHLKVDETIQKKIFWELELPPARSPFKPIQSPSEGTKKILHLTDVHLDLWYHAQSNASCNEALCCRDNSMDLKSKNYSAGHWASDHGACDVPLNFVVDSLKQIANRHHFDAVFWTGDNVPHDVWNTTQQINLRHIHTMSGLVKVAFDGIPIFPALGNHETHPINLYIPSEISERLGKNMSWLYGQLATDYWAQWIDTAQAKDTFQKGGYYAKVMNPGWKVIVLNTNMPQKANFWQVANYFDPDGQLTWLMTELDKSETAGQYVSILGHIPPGYGIYDTWLHNYIRIVDRYSHIINAGYFGHTHKDEVKVLYNEKMEPININYLSGSLTTYSFLNPMYAVYEVNNNGFVQNSTVYMSNVRENEHSFQKNETSRPEWHKEYEPKTSYKMDDMSANSWNKFLSEAADNIDLAHLYSGHYHRFSPQYTKHHPFSEKKLFQLIKNAQPCSPFHEKCVLPEHDDDEDDDDEDGGGFD